MAGKEKQSLEHSKRTAEPLMAVQQEGEQLS